PGDVLAGVGVFAERGQRYLDLLAVDGELDRRLLQEGGGVLVQVNDVVVEHDGDQAGGVAHGGKPLVRRSRPPGAGTCRRGKSNVGAGASDGASSGCPSITPPLWERVSSNLPPPLWGRVGVGGTGVDNRTRLTPHPNPPPQGGR